MESVSQLSIFFLQVVDDPRIGPMHNSLYGALFSLSEKQDYAEPLSVFSYEVMPLCKISSTATYHKTIKELHDYGYIKYIPSYNHFLGSLIYFILTTPPES